MRSLNTLSQERTCDNKKAELMLKISRQQSVSLTAERKQEAPLSLDSAAVVKNYFKKIHFPKWQSNPEPDDGKYSFTVVRDAKTIMIGVRVKYNNNDGHFAIKGRGKF